MQIVPVILAGGSGTRLWPLSRQKYPKQYLPLVGDNTMLQETILRLRGLEDALDPVIVCNHHHRFLVAEQCQKVGVCNPTILLEPVGKNTAPAITVAALQVQKILEDSILLVLSADHAIQDTEAFCAAIQVAKQQAEIGKLVTFGIVPTGVNTGYGYIKFSKAGIGNIHTVEKFVEKPGLKNAEFYVKDGGYLWNSGIFMFRPESFIQEMVKYSPNIVKAVESSLDNSIQDFDFIRLDETNFELSPSDSIDYAVMEKSDKVVVVPLDAKWSDVGSWASLYDISDKNSDGNVIRGDVIADGVSDTYINATGHLVVVMGVQNLIIVDTPDATLVSTKDKSQEIKQVVGKLQKQCRKEGSYHRKVSRPWGWYDSIDSDKYFQVKRLYINPGAKLSLQMHRKRAEYWVVVRGVAQIVNGGETTTLKKGESTYIPPYVRHSLENNTSDPLEVIEVQSGRYFGEDDIVRFDDMYNRM